MKFMKQNRIFGTLFAISSVLMAVACFTITNTYSYPDEHIQAKKWSVSIKDVKTNKDDMIVNVVNDKIDLGITLNKFGEIATTNFVIANEGSFDAYLNKIDITDISNIKVGTSNETNKTYYLSDYVDIAYRYASDNKANSIQSGSSILSGDLLGKYTKNEVVASIKYKEEKELSEDALVVLRQNINLENGNRPLKFSISICFNYIENTK